MNQKWDADNYFKNFSFVHKYGFEVLNLIDRDKVKSALDLGCGNGILTNELKNFGFNVEVTGLDASDEMLNIAKNNYPEIKFIKGDATNFKLNSPVDLIFSNAVLHWIEKSSQPKMMECVNNSLKSGGQFIFEMGGHENNILIHSTLKKIFESRNLKYIMPFYFPSIGEYSAMLENSGFKVCYAILFDRPTPLDGEDGLLNWLKMFQKNQFKNIPDDVHEEILKEAVGILRPKLYKNNIWYSDYVRLRMRAIKI